MGMPAMCHFFLVGKYPLRGMGSINAVEMELLVVMSSVVRVNKLWAIVRTLR